jgi:glycosyltransferase involved in cell wall biosynthesis
MGQMMKVLFTTPVLEHPPAGGPQLRIENSIKALGRICDLHVVSRVSRGNIGGAVAERYISGLCRSFSYAPSCRWRSTNRYLRKLQSLLGEITGLDVRRDARYLLEQVDKMGVDVLWFGYGNISFPLMQAIRTARPKLKLVCDTDSVWSRFVLRELPYAGNGRRRAAIKRRGVQKENEERAWVMFCDVTTAVSQVDADFYRSIGPEPHRVRIFSNVVDLSSYREVPATPGGFKKPCMFLAGTFGNHNSPMDTAARWVLQEILPRVQSQIPDVHFYIVGKGSDRTLGYASGPSVTVTGQLPSVLPYLSHADVSLVPIKFESGTRFKILEAAACKVPVVSTVLGAEGLPVVNGEHVLLADEAEHFASAVVELINNKAKAQQLAKNCHQMLKQNFSVEHLETEAREILGALEK